MSSNKRPNRRQSRSRKTSQAKSTRPAQRTPEPVDSEQSVTRNQLLIVGIGASAGGLEACTHLLQHLPTDTGMAFVLVQHLDPARESALSDILSRATSLPVREVESDQPVEPNHVYVIPPNANLSISGAVLKLQPRQRAGPHRSIDSFFESLAQDRREQAIGVILSGTATDGTLGLEAIKAEGGITFAQDDSAKYNSMPRSAVAAGCVDFVLKPEDIGKELARIAKHPFVAGHIAFPEDDRTSATAHEGDETPLPIGRSRNSAQRSKASARRSQNGAGQAGRERLQKDSSPPPQPQRRGFRALQIHHDPAAHHAANDIEQARLP